MQRDFLDWLSFFAEDHQGAVVSLPDLERRSSSQVRRAASTLRARGWLDTQPLLSEVAPTNPGTHVEYDQDLRYWVSHKTGRKVTTVRRVLHARFARAAAPPFLAKLVSLHLDLFEELFECRVNRGDAALRHAISQQREGNTPQDLVEMKADYLSWVDLSRATAARQAQIFEDLTRDRVRWTDAFGPTLKPEWVYYRWESARLPSEAWPDDHGSWA